MAKITYLFGAGASAKTLPTINQMPERINQVIRYLSEHEFDQNFHLLS